MRPNEAIVTVRRGPVGSDLGHTRFSWPPQGVVPPGRTAFSWGHGSSLPPALSLQLGKRVWSGWFRTAPGAYPAFTAG
jgi:hypothetical protein